MRILTFFAYIAIFVVFVYVAHRFVGFLEAYGCRDDGGIVKAGACVGADHGHWRLVSGIPFSRWLISLGIPALVTVFIWKIAELILGLLRRLFKQRGA